MTDAADQPQPPGLAVVAPVYGAGFGLISLGGGLGALALALAACAGLALPGKRTALHAEDEAEPATT